MTKIQSPVRNPFSLLKIAFTTISANPVILYPYVILAFFQLAILEVLFFAPRYPLVEFFGPIITKLEGPAYLHYPYNFLLLTKWFHSIQTPVYIFFNSLILGIVVWIVATINSGKKVEIGRAFQRSISLYVHVVLAAALSVVILYMLSYGYSLILKRALQIKSTSGLFFMIKESILVTSPIGNLFLASLVTSLFAFVIPAVIIERKNFFSALIFNFRRIFSSLGILFVAMFLSGILYLPILVLESPRLAEFTLSVPEMRGWITVAGVCLMLFIDGLQCTAITIYYLVKKESTA